MDPLTDPTLRNFLKDLNRSLIHWTGHSLVDNTSPAPEQLFRLPVALVAHGTEADPIFCFGNQMALDLFEMDWETFTALPSRLSAEPVNREERAGMLAEVEQSGYTDTYQGVRITRTGKRFYIKQATVWNVLDESGQRIGQAAWFATWEFI